MLKAGYRMALIGPRELTTWDLFGIGFIMGIILEKPIFFTKQKFIPTNTIIYIRYPNTNHCS